MSGTEASATKEGLRQDGSKNWIVSFASPDRSAIRKSGFRFAAEALFDPSAAGDGSLSPAVAVKLAVSPSEVARE